MLGEELGMNTIVSFSLRWEPELLFGEIVALYSIKEIWTKDR